MADKEEPKGQTGENAVEVPTGTAAIPMHQQKKLGGRCCGCFCDYRRAVIMVAIVFILVSVYWVIVYAGAIALPSSKDVYFDDQAQEIMDDGKKYLLIYSSIALLFSVLAGIGAVIFSYALVGLNVLWMIVNYILFVYQWVNAVRNVNETSPETDDVALKASAIKPCVFQGLVVLFYLYPQIGFIYEVRKGIMSKETYPREEFSCCCVGRR